ncbi:DUF397 domain-containing protein [Streptomyces smyrnaeus]|uniref:DUF397 domain-containing protein n=1 Tax=Streptomyces smyrnaeus TaxID=1387713 RepID=UPI0033DE4248
MPLRLDAQWVRSSYSGDDGPACVEVAATSGTVHVRDSKVPTGPQLAVAPTTWARFISYATVTD